MKFWKVNKEELLLSNKWQRVIRKVGNYTYFYFFFTLKEDGMTFILNTRTLKCSSIQGTNHKIIPLVLDLSRDTFTHKGKEIYKTYKEYICIDNWVIDSNFNQTFIETKYNSHLTVLDSLDYYVAAEDSQGIHLFKIDYSGRSLIIKESQYFYKRLNDNKVGLFIDDNLANLSTVDYFNPLDKKFFVDVSKIKKKNKWAEERRLQELDPAEHYGLMDALDGEVDAYWNID